MATFSGVGSPESPSRPSPPGSPKGNGKPPPPPWPPFLAICSSPFWNRPSASSACCCSPWPRGALRWLSSPAAWPMWPRPSPSIWAAPCGKTGACCMSCESFCWSSPARRSSPCSRFASSSSLAASPGVSERRGSGWACWSSLATSASFWPALLAWRWASRSTAGSFPTAPGSRSDSAASSSRLAASRRVGPRARCTVSWAASRSRPVSARSRSAAASRAASSSASERCGVPGWAWRSDSPASLARPASRAASWRAFSIGPASRCRWACFTLAVSSAARPWSACTSSSSFLKASIACMRAAWASSGRPAVRCSPAIIWSICPAIWSSAFMAAATSPRSSAFSASSRPLPMSFWRDISAMASAFMCSSWKPRAVSAMRAMRASSRWRSRRSCASASCLAASLGASR